ncbi:MAG TPA: hypothetical protein VFM18_08690 [Methanosarcina sp.]|nr:hypothetical protein [Methanosarcina sp.]
MSGFTIDDIQGLIDANPYLRGYVQGYLAEHVLASQLRSLPGVSLVEKIPDSNPEWGDLAVTYLGERMTIECKSLRTGSLREDVLHEAWESAVLCKNTDKRTVYIEGLGEIQSINLKKGDFDILAICTYPVTGEWRFLFLENRFLPEPDDKPGFIKSQFIINTATTPCLTGDAVHVLDNVLSRKSRFVS